jgi:hypothetical protein
MADIPLLHRKEVRVPLKMFVNLRSSDSPSSEIAPIIDISCHGARVCDQEELAARSTVVDSIDPWKSQISWPSLPIVNHAWTTAL